MEAVHRLRSRALGETHRDNDWETIAGKKDQLVGRIQEKYGVAKAEAERQADEWSNALKQSERESHGATHL